MNIELFDNLKDTGRMGPMQGTPASPPPSRRGRSRKPTVQLRAIQQLNEEFARHLRDRLTVNATDLDAMTHLVQSGPLSPGELARRLDLSGAAVTTVVDRLESVGHAQREQHPSDRRGVLVVPNDDSVRRALDAIVPMAGRLDAVLDSFSPAEQEAIERYLGAVIDSYRAYLDDQDTAESSA